MKKFLIVILLVGLLTACGFTLQEVPKVPTQNPETVLLATAVAELKNSIKDLKAEEGGVPLTSVPECTACPECQNIEEIRNFDSCEDSVPLIDRFGPEQTFPGEAIGPSLAEIWDQESGFCAVIKVQEGEVLVWGKSGAYWEACSKEALELRFSHHSDEYIKKYPNCKVITVEEVPTNPT
ncbi:MAG: hypothetical protein ABIJ05_05695 [Patescibacteria group bacterium]